ncbi:MAG TPA: hypothetical protein VNO31_31730 [Umezawaea sp.]|nr:hypothetical protein [Umezawaea sp.]
MLAFLDGFGIKPWEREQLKLWEVVALADLIDERNRQAEREAAEARRT